MMEEDCDKLRLLFEEYRLEYLKAHERENTEVKRTRWMAR